LEGKRLFYNIQVILIILFIASVFGYIFSILKEKIYLKNNIILIEKKAVTQEHLNDTDMKEFIIDGLKVKSGDEIKLITKEKNSYIGILIGAKKKDKEILIVTHGDEIKNVKIENILKFKIVSKYGRFFN
jgi:hypothetical protein